MVMAISLQKLDTPHAGLADSYYLASMHYFEEVVRPKDLQNAAMSGLNRAVLAIDAHQSCRVLCSWAGHKDMPTAWAG